MRKVILITGATSGIGLECVSRFLEINDVIVFAIGRNFSKMNINNDRLIVRKCDVTKIDEVNTIVNEIKSYGTIDCVINAAGVTSRGDNTIDEHDSIQKMIETNILGTTNVIECVLPIMRENKFGTVINLSSLADRYPRPNNAIYAATKAYVKSLSDSLRLQNAKYNIRVVNLAPALVATPMVNDVLGIKDGTINIKDFGEIIKFIYTQPQDVCIRDIVIAPTSYEG
ncbi:MAG TPA: SDR family oxidoreductase [Burkholderiales bacterium]|nr:SDR family oxidoreductase [Burkholderiales bacterium]